MKRESYSFQDINVHVSLNTGFASPETSIEAVMQTNFRSILQWSAIASNFLPILFMLFVAKNFVHANV